MASLVTDSVDRLESSIRQLAPLVRSGELLGIHLEGPWLSPHQAGAHDPGLLRAPTPADIDRLLDAGEGAVRMVTLAPELDGGLEAVHRLAGRGVTVAVGHTDASYAVTCQAVAAGAVVGTHLFNAMRPLHHREPGPALALLEDPAVHVELIADGIHLHPATLRAALRAVPDRSVLVSDAMSAAGGGDGEYLLGPLPVTVRDGVARLTDTGAVAGSTLTLAAAVRFAVTRAGLSPDQAIRAATATPAAAVGATDVGILAAGARADLLVLDPDLAPTAVMRRGAWLHVP
jgi:N-acetylglucosamine-6-phosphate deacetylase